MKKLIPFILGTLLVALVVEIILLSPSDLDIGQNAFLDEDIIASERVDQVMRGVHYMEASEEQKEWELWADVAKNYKTDNQLRLEVVKVIFFSDKGSFIVTGDSGFVHQANKNLEIYGNVVVTSENGYVFTTDKAIYISSEKKLKAPGLVNMLGPKDERGFRLTLVGDSLVSFVKTSLIHVLGNVKTKKRIKAKQVIHIKSEKANLSGVSSFAQFVDNVIMDMQDLRVSGHQAKFNYSKNKNLVESISVEGNIHVSDKEKWATAESLKAYLEEDKYVFRGSPKVVQDNDELRGEEIIFYEGGDRVQVKGANMRLQDERNK